MLIASIEGTDPIKDTQLHSICIVICKIAVNINIVIYSLGEVDRQHSEASTINTVHYTVARLLITQPIKQPHHKTHGNLGPQRTQLLLSVCTDRGRERDTETHSSKEDSVFPSAENGNAYCCPYAMLIIKYHDDSFQRIMVLCCWVFQTGQCLMGISLANFFNLHLG